MRLSDWGDARPSRGRDYELFRHFFGQPPGPRTTARRSERPGGVILSVVGMLSEGATHVGVATDHVIESFRNDLWPGYKTGAGIAPELRSQFQILETALEALGVVLWPMVELEADDALASAASVAAEDPAVEQVIICTPDKDLAQCVVGERVVQLDRRSGTVMRRGRRVGQVRGRTPLDPRLAGPGRGLRRRVPRAGRVGQALGVGGAGPLREL